MWVFCASVVPLQAQDNPVLEIWPGPVPGEADLDAEQLQSIADKESRNETDRVFGVSRPTLTVCRAAAERANGTSVVICPGGGYNVLAWAHEGQDIARWMNSLGVHAFILKYRVPRRHPDFVTPPLQDVQRAIRLVRSQAERWEVDPGRIGVLGFSAGGNLAVNAGTRYAEATYTEIDDSDRVSARPDFMIPIYAAYLGASGNDRILGDHVKVTPEAPPTFLAVTQDDRNRGLHAALLFAELTRAGVPAEIHVYTKGGHGYGMRPSHNAVSEWPARCADWMNAMGYLSHK